MFVKESKKNDNAKKHSVVITMMCSLPTSLIYGLCVTDDDSMSIYAMLCVRVSLNTKATLSQYNWLLHFLTIILLSNCGLWVPCFQ